MSKAISKQVSNIKKACGFLRTTLNDSYWISQLAGYADTMTQNKDGNWRIEIDSLELPIEKQKHIKPEGLNDNLKLFVSICMEWNEQLWNKCEDCIKKLNFSVNIIENNIIDSQCNYQMGFRIDKCLTGNNSSDMHPLYHIHYVNGSIIDGKQTISMDVPRLAHHPVDLLLGILLAYANFNTADYQKIIEDGGFMSLCRDSADHIIAPYFNALSRSPWKKDISSDYSKALCPYLVL